jgi:hypothetical protein
VSGDPCTLYRTAYGFDPLVRIARCSVDHAEDADDGRANPPFPSFFAIAAWLAAGTAVAEEPARFDWCGVYIGVHGGGALGLVDVGDLYGASLYGDTVRTPGVLAGGQLGYNWQRGALVYGLEADLSWPTWTAPTPALPFRGPSPARTARPT